MSRRLAPAGLHPQHLNFLARWWAAEDPSYAHACRAETTIAALTDVATSWGGMWALHDVTALDGDLPGWGPVLVHVAAVSHEDAADVPCALHPGWTGTLWPTVALLAGPDGQVAVVRRSAVRCEEMRGPGPCSSETDVNVREDLTAAILDGLTGPERILIGVARPADDGEPAPTTDPPPTVHDPGSTQADPKAVASLDAIAAAIDCIRTRHPHARSPHAVEWAAECLARSLADTPAADQALRLAHACRAWHYATEPDHGLDETYAVQRVLAHLDRLRGALT